MNALEEVHSAFGVSTEVLDRCLEGGLLHFSPNIAHILAEGAKQVHRIRDDTQFSIRSILLHGPPRSGKTALAAKIALDSDFPFVQLVSPEDVRVFTEMAKKDYIDRIFVNAHKSALAIVILDSIEQLIEWNALGPRFSNSVLGLIKTLARKKPPKGRRLLVLATTSSRSVVNQLGLMEAFDRQVAVPNVATLGELYEVLVRTGAFGK